MKKIIKIYVLMFFIILFLLTSVNAFSINMNLENNTPTDTTSIVEENSTEDDLSENETLNISIDDDEVNDSSRKATKTISDEDEFLTAENILSIVIIVIGILLIFLAIAILVRFK